jgi:uncharacterized HAD superfamily protein
MNNVLSLVRVGFDMDGVLADTVGACLEYLKARDLIPSSATHGDVTQWDWDACFPGLSGEAVSQMFDAPDVYEKAAPLMEAIALGRHLVKHGAQVHVVTARPSSVYAVTAEWLNRYRMPYHRLAFVPGRSKPAYANEQQLDVFIEDKLETAVTLGKWVEVSFLFDRPWNRLTTGMTFDVPYRRFYAWSELRHYFGMGAWL